MDPPSWMVSVASASFLACAPAPPRDADASQAPVPSASALEPRRDASAQVEEAKRLLETAVTKEDRERARKAFEDACALDDRACAWLPDRWDYERPRALELYERACAAGDGLGCTGAGMIDFDEGRTERGIARLTVACKAHWAGGCFNLIMLASNGDPAHDIPLYVLGCEGGAMNGCSLLADAYYDGVGVAKNEQRALELYEKACALDQGTAPCEKLESLRHK